MSVKTFVLLSVVCLITSGATAGNPIMIGGKEAVFCFDYLQDIPCGDFASDIPNWVKTIVNNDLAKNYVIPVGPNLSHLGLDFNHDGKWEVVVPIGNRKSKEAGLAILNSADSSYKIIGAGQEVWIFAVQFQHYQLGCRYSRQS